MREVLYACAIFLAAFTLNMLYITVFYHRALTHRAVGLSPIGRRIVLASAQWITGLDLKTWCCMHRLHHIHSDTEHDPHSPVHVGIFGVLRAQIDSFAKTRLALVHGDKEYTELVRDLDFPVSWISRTGFFWITPYVMHALVAAALTWASGLWPSGLAYWLGMMSHPIQGWMVNSFAHCYGYRNFPTPDNSRNNTLVAWLTMGEGLQNNHHRCPRAANFARRSGEVDLGFQLLRLTAVLGVIQFRRIKVQALPAALAQSPAPRQQRPQQRRERPGSFPGQPQINQNAL